MKTLFAAVFAAGMLIASAPEATAHGGFYYGRYPYAGFYGGYGFGGYGDGYPGFGYGFAPVSQTVVTATTYYPPIYAPPAYYGGWGSGWGSWDSLGQIGGLGYPYRYYTHAPGYSFSYHSGTVPTYYPGQFGYGNGYYGYGPFGW
ncbi:MAG: hypothetical protein H0T47_05575 [Planctomycetaceae bacterium]|nr:hypothetical protein [Planctomycetaceae bacterium]